MRMQLSPLHAFRLTTRTHQKFLFRISELCMIGGESGIRTHGRFDPSPVFKTGALNRSAISPMYTATLPRRWRAVFAGLTSGCAAVPSGLGLRVKTGALNRSAISPDYRRAPIFD